MLHTIEIDGLKRDIDVRPMDEAFIVYRKMYVAPLTPANTGYGRRHADRSILGGANGFCVRRAVAVAGFLP